MNKRCPSDLGFDIVEYQEQYYFVSTVNLPLRRLESVLTGWRDDWWLPPYPNETMVWLSDKDGNRLGTPIHCQGYRLSESAKRNHIKLCNRIKRIGRDALNGRAYQTTKSCDGEPRGLIASLEKRIKGIAL